MNFSKRDLFLNSLRRCETHYLPWDIKFSSPVRDKIRQIIGAETLESYFQLTTRDLYFRPWFAPDAFVAYGITSDLLVNEDGWEIGQWGVGQEGHQGDHFVHLKPPLSGLSCAEELASYPFPDLTNPSCHQHLADAVRELHEKGLAAIGYMEWSIFEIAWYMRGMENLLIDFTENPKFANYLLDRITAIRSEQSALFAHKGVDLIKLGDDVGTQKGMLMSPQTWREWLKPRLAAVITAAKRTRDDVLVMYHSDGDVTEIVPDLIEVGVDVLNPIQPECMDIAKLKREYGLHLSFWGGLGTQTTMPFGTSDEVRRAVLWLARTMGQDGGFLLAPTHLIEPEVPWENIVAAFETVMEYNRGIMR